MPSLTHSYLRVSSDPVGGFRVIVALLDPTLEEVALNWVMPVLTTVEAEHLTALAHDGPGIWVLHLDRIVAVGVWTPTQ